MSGPDAPAKRPSPFTSSQSAGGLGAVPYKGKSIANAFITLANRDGCKIDPLKLQKLLYFANGYFLAENDELPLINEYFEAWDYGPVIPTVYYEFREYGDRPIKRFAYTIDERTKQTIIAPQPLADQEAEDVIAWVWANYHDFSGPQLSRMTHKSDTPWARARKKASNYGMRNERLDNHEIAEYFRALTD